MEPAVKKTRVRKLQACLTCVGKNENVTEESLANNVLLIKVPRYVSINQISY